MFRWLRWKLFILQLVVSCSASRGFVKTSPARANAPPSLRSLLEGETEDGQPLVDTTLDDHDDGMQDIVFRSVGAAATDFRCSLLTFFVVSNSFCSPLLLTVGIITQGTAMQLRLLMVFLLARSFCSSGFPLTHFLKESLSEFRYFENLLIVLINSDEYAMCRELAAGDFWV